MNGMVASQQQLIRRVNTSQGSPGGKSPSTGQEALTPGRSSSSSRRESMEPRITGTSINTDQDHDHDSLVVASSSTSKDLGPNKDVQSSLQLTPKPHKGKRSSTASAWLNLLNPTYKSRYEEFKRIFTASIPSNERLVVDYSCALQKEILVQGRLYISINYICFYANIFKWETMVVIKCRDIASLTKANTARVIPNAIQLITGGGDKYVFTSFAARDKTYVMMFRIWQNALLDQSMSSAELWQWVHLSYGDDLGFTSDEEEEYVNVLSRDELLKEAQNAAAAGILIPSGSESSSSSDELMSNKRIILPKLLKQRPEDGEPVEIELKEMGNKENLNTENTEPISMIDDLTPTFCTHTEHEGKECLNERFNMPIDKFFRLAFTDSKFFRNLLAERKTTNISVSPWRQVDDSKHGSDEIIKIRQLSYTVALNHTLAKTAATIETQRLLPESKPGQLYMIKSEAANSGVPYSDTFTVESQWCITKGNSHQECCVRVHAQILFKKSSWGFGLMKSIIEKSAVHGVTDYCKDLAKALQKSQGIIDDDKNEICDPVKENGEDNVMNNEIINDSDFISQVGVRNTPFIVSNDSSNLIGLEFGHKDAAGSSSTRLSASAKSSSLPRFKPNDETYLLKIILSVLFLLLILNLLLYIRLWHLEAIAKDYDNLLVATGKLQPSQKTSSFFGFPQNSIPTEKMMEKWRQVISSAIRLIKLMEDNLLELSNSFKDEL